MTGVGQIGCIPYQLARYDGNVNGNRCNEEINSAISLFNTGLKRVVDRFNRGLLPGARFVYLDSFQSSQDLAENARTYGRGVACVSILHCTNQTEFWEIYAFFFWLCVCNATGFDVVDEGCCGVGRNNGQITCLPLQMPCDERGKYLFWDAFHPTEAANIVLAKKAYSSKSRSFAYPINIQQLAML